MDKAVLKYNDVSGEKKLLDWAQKSFKCCGSSGSSDYPKSTSNNTVCAGTGGVPSCYSNGKCTGGTLYTQGCRKGFIDFIKSKLVVIGAVAVGIAFIQVNVYITSNLKNVVMLLGKESGKFDI